MSCNCGTSYTSDKCARRFMRIDNIIFDKKYVSKLIFTDEYFSILFKGDCKEYKFPLSTPKSANQIAAYQLELNSCGDEYIVDMTTNDHSKLINLDLDDQHPISAIINLSSTLDSKLDKESSYWETDKVSVSGVEYQYMYKGVNPISVPVTLENISNCAELFINVLLALKNNTELPNINDDVINTLTNHNFNVQTSMLDNPLSYFISNSDNALFGFVGGINIVYDINSSTTYKILSSLDVINNLESDNYLSPLSARQGKVLSNRIVSLTEQLYTKASVETTDKLENDLREKATYSYVNSSLDNKQYIIEPTLFNNLPSPATYPFKIYFVSDKSCLAISDGSSWLKIKLESF